MSLSTLQQPMALASFAVLAVLLTAAVMSDVKSRRIPNRLVVHGLALAAGIHLVSVFLGQATLAPPALWSPLAGMLAGLAFLLPLYLIRACGAGDVKLMAMVGAFVGPGVALSAGVYTLVAGGVLSLAVMALHGVTAQTLANVRFILTEWRMRAHTGNDLRLAPLSTTAARLPYGVAIAAGTLLALLRPLALLS
ncbi:prepilin peptidase [Piscinibacter sp. XHJ-5]|uniref:A24 family peptidase n=1 Tax=Piscinibacter sp. XHJ-5 TaxID=3037797 RepID=UPI002452D9A0|nr:prepilin peptidase [Piscinibacter sp. XHJ-5]